MQYAGPAFLTPILAWILISFGWKEIFYVTGFAGLTAAAIWYLFYRDPKDSGASPSELAYIKAGGGTGDGDHVATAQLPFLVAAREILSHRQVWGMFIGQFSVQTTLFFFLTWFPTYLINGKGLTILKGGFYAAIPFLAAIAGTLIAGKWSDRMVRDPRWAGQARKLPIILGFVLSASILGANFTDSIAVVLLFMSIASMGQAMASTVTGALLSDIAPREAVGTLGGLLYFFANVGGTSAPYIVGRIVDSTGGFNMALVYVSTVAMAGVLSYLFLIGSVYRIQMPVASGGAVASGPHR
jgi:ACS family D-galactonate transporter-like MFS transporter